MSHNFDEGNEETFVPDEYFSQLGDQHTETIHSNFTSKEDTSGWSPEKHHFPHLDDTIQKSPQLELEIQNSSHPYSENDVKTFAADYEVLRLSSV